MKLLVFLLVFGLLIVLIIPLVGWYRIHNTLNHRVSANSDLESKYDLPKKSVSFSTKDKKKIAGWYIPVQNPKAVVILVHGRTQENGGKPLMLGHAQYLYKAGYSTLLIDLRGVGESDGDRVYLGIHEWQDIEAAYDYLKSLEENRDKKIGYLGISMGATTSIVSAGLTDKGDFLVASVPYAGINEILTFRINKEGTASRIMIPFITPVSMLEFGHNYKKFTAKNQISNVNVPILLVSAKNDDSVSPKDALFLFDNANEPKVLWKTNTGHDVFAEEPEEFKEKVLEFLNKYVN